MWHTYYVVIMQFYFSGNGMSNLCDILAIPGNSIESSLDCYIWQYQKYNTGIIYDMLFWNSWKAI